MLRDPHHRPGRNGPVLRHPRRTTAPAGFGKLTGDLLVASFGDGTVSAFDASGAFVDLVRGADGKALVNPGIWALLPGNGASLGAADTVYFTAGPDGENAGVFGRIDAATPS